MTAPTLISRNSPSYNHLQEMLAHLHIKELENLLSSLGLSATGMNKQELITRLLYYVVTGTQLAPLTIPAVSRASKGHSYPLHAETLMLYGAYKNDAQTRAFFKQLIGTHFHFTAHGIDWLRERWLTSNPPTYREFATYWQATYEQNKTAKPAAKQEWAYIRFTQAYVKQFPQNSAPQLRAAWNKHRAACVQYVIEFFSTFHKGRNSRSFSC